MAVLTGGIYDSEDMDTSGWSADDAARESDGVRLKPFAVVRFKSTNPFGPRGVEAERGSVEIYCYADSGVDTLDSAIGMIKTLLNRHSGKKIGRFFWGTSNRSLAHLVFDHASGAIPAEEFGGCPSMFIRFMLTQTRK
jgi:hypothetical protein